MRWWLVLLCAMACGDDERPERCEAPRAEEVLDPGRLECYPWGDTQCDPECGPCGDAQTTYGSCANPCFGLLEPTCAADDRCRVTKRLECELSGECASYFQCVPTDKVVDLTVDCDRTADAQRCSQSPNCTAWHMRVIEAHLDDPGGYPVNVFRACSVEGTPPGLCYAPVTCDQAPPACPGYFEKPLVKDGCYTGGCIREVDCEPM
jgi:hypothetical protein